MELLIVTGMSGAGKSRTIDALEDIGFYCVDNMPPKLLSRLSRSRQIAASCSSLEGVTMTRAGPPIWKVV